MRPIPAYKAGLYGLTEDRQLSESNSKPPFIPVHRTGHSGNFSKMKGLDFGLRVNSVKDLMSSFALFRTGFIAYGSSE